MTVTYSLQVSTARMLGFPRLLLKWKGSIYKLMYRETLIFIFLYYFLMLVYRVFLTDPQRRTFEELATYCREFLELIPITFALGFYVTLVVSRWWEQYMTIPWPDRTCLQIATFVRGDDERSRMIRRTLCRYLNLMSVLVFRMVSKPIWKRFPTMDHLLEAGLLTVNERICLDETPSPNGNWWMPSCWFLNLMNVARQENRITDEYHVKMITNEMLTFKGYAGHMFSFDWISVPIVYTQVVTLAVYSFVLASLFGRQYLYEIPPDGTRYANFLDYYFPLFTTFQFVFYMGWLKVAEELICAYGDDDDDLEINWCIDRNVQVCYMMVDEMYAKYPELSRDAFWEEKHAVIPYTEAAAEYRQTPYIGSTAQVELSSSQMEWAEHAHEYEADKPQTRNGTVTDEERSMQTPNVPKTFDPVPMMRRKLQRIWSMTSGGGTSSSRPSSRSSKVNPVNPRQKNRSEQSSMSSSANPGQTRSASATPSSPAPRKSRIPRPNALNEYNDRKRSLARRSESAYAKVEHRTKSAFDNQSLISVLISDDDNSSLMGNQLGGRNQFSVQSSPVMARQRGGSSIRSGVSYKDESLQARMASAMANSLPNVTEKEYDVAASNNEPYKLSTVREEEEPSGTVSTNIRQQRIKHLKHQARTEPDDTEDRF